ncbi:hypothetical protein BAU15_01870 [Enterococcus sp. JM4C]|uniref:GNAT family N-acetyltransferase n=1 Tax=Candidatus Enterococcus huntleyi TaxID=1857217 RepID=UPI00137AD373|nr:GNAT family N-acetyltransferase [Enterococcus sp. JM4C]KAF1299417.1 hypothetical protein BAU15_01870 [Enterococcus sp. JM4C]
MHVKLVSYNQKYLPAILELFNTTIQQVNRKDYSQAEINQWIQLEPDFDAWDEKLSTTYSLVALANEEVVGFGNITDTGYLDLFYVSHTMIHQGVGRLIYNALEQFAVAQNTKSIVTDASITAMPFFEKMGFQVIRKQDNYRNGENLINYRMEKVL